MFETIQERLAYIMQEKKLSQTKLAEKAGVSQVAMSNVMTGRNGISKKTADTLSLALGINVQWLMTGEGEIWVEPDRVDLITKFAANAINQPEEFKSKFIEYIAELDEKDWAALERMAKKLVEMQKKQKETSGE